MRRGIPVSPAVPLFIILFALSAIGALSAQETDAIPSDKPDTQTTVQSLAPTVTVWPDTFAWRTATTGVGSFPFTYLFVNLGFDLVRFGFSGFDISYAPWPFRNQNSAAIGGTERIARIATALGSSLVIGLLDAIFSKP
jgi:hypothetical protein